MGAAELPEEQAELFVDTPEFSTEEQQEQPFLLNTVPNSGNTTNNPGNNIVPIGRNRDYSY